MANKSDRKTIIEACGNVVKLASGIGTWKIVNWVLDAVMPASVKLPIRVCVRTAMWVLTGVVQEKSDDYIDRSANDISEAIEKGIAQVKNETEQEEEESSDSAKEAAENAVKRNNYIQKRKDKNAFSFKNFLDGRDDGNRFSWEFEDHKMAVTALHVLQAHIEDRGGSKDEVESVEMVTNLAAHPPKFTIVIPKNIALHYAIEKEGGES